MLNQQNIFHQHQEFVQQGMHPVQFQIIPQQTAGGQQINPVSPAIPQPTHIQVQSPPSSLPKPQIGYHQNSMVSPPSRNSTSPSSSSGNSHGTTMNLPMMTSSMYNDDERKMRDKCLYLKQLLQDKKQIQNLTGCFLHVDRILDEGRNLIANILFLCKRIITK